MAIVQCWRVHWWVSGELTFSWPQGVAWVPGGDWFEACENGRTHFGAAPADTVLAMQLTP